jgi:hypothetical protein
LSGRGTKGSRILKPAGPCLSSPCSDAPQGIQHYCHLTKGTFVYLCMEVLWWNLLLCTI